MKLKFYLCWLLVAFIFDKAEGQDNNLKYNPASMDYVKALKDSLVSLSEKPGNDFFRMDCTSILAVINSKYSLSKADSTFLTSTYKAFMNTSDPANALKMNTYLQRKRPLILSWVSPTDGTVSFSWLTLPKDWNPENKYPLYVNLHGLWSVAANQVEYMTYPYLQSPSGSTSFEDGYLLSPWGRGNLWYKDIAETDIWECIAALEKTAIIDPARKYLSGHSMGGYGAWSIARKSPGTWAALGIMAGAFWYYPNVLDDVAAQTLKDMPTYFVCGTRDGLLEVNQTAYQLLMDAGNWHLQFTTFSGGHEYLEQNVLNMYLWMRQYVKRELPTDIIQPEGTSQSGFGITCRPNPVSTTSSIAFSGRDNAIADIGIYDLYGRYIEDVARGVRVSGEHSINYDASGLKSGIYIVRLKSGEETAETKMAVIH
jgi:predicted esterase